VILVLGGFATGGICGSPNGLAKVRLDCSSSRQELGTNYSRRRKVPANQKLETFLQAGMFLIPQQSRHSPVLPAASQKMQGPSDIFLLLPIVGWATLINFVIARESRPGRPSIRCKQLARSESMMAARKAFPNLLDIMLCALALVLGDRRRHAT